MYWVIMRIVIAAVEEEEKQDDGEEVTLKTVIYTSTMGELARDRIC